MVSRATPLTLLDFRSVIMRDPLVVSPDVPVMTALILMHHAAEAVLAQPNADLQCEAHPRSARSSCVVVVECDRVIGLFTEQDLVRLSVQQQPLESVPIRQVMTHPVKTLRESDELDLGRVVHLFQHQHIRYLPIVDEQERLTGVVTQADLLQVLNAALGEREQAEQHLQSLIQGTASTTGKDFFPALVTHIANALQVAYVIVTEKDGDMLRSLAFWANGSLHPMTVFDPAQTPCGHTLRAGNFCCECRLAQQFPANLSLAEMGIESYLGVALQDAQGNPIGSLCILDNRPIRDPQRTQNLLQVFAARAAAELARQRATDALEQLNQALEQKVTERTAALQASETRFRQVYSSNIVGMLFTDCTGRITDANDRFLDIIGYSRADLEARRINWVDLTPPEHMTNDVIAIEQLERDHRVIPWEKEYYRKDGSRVAVLVGAASLSDTDSSCVCVVLDIQDRKHAEQTIRKQIEREQLLREITQRIRQSLDLQTIFETACEEIRRVLQADRVSIFKFDPDCAYAYGTFVAEALVPGCVSVLQLRVQEHYFSENCAALYAQGRFLAIDDIYDSGMATCHVELLAQFQVRGNLVMPLLAGDQLWGLLCVHQCMGVRRWQQGEIDLTQQLAIQLAIAIQQANLYEQIQSELQVRQQAETKIALQLRRQQGLGAIVHQIRESLNITEILATVTQQVKEVLHGDRVIVFQLFADGRSQIVEESVGGDLPSLKSQHWPDEQWSQDVLDCYWHGHPRIVPDVMQDVWTHCLQDYSVGGQIQSKIVAPILLEVPSGERHRWIAPWGMKQLWGILVIHACHEKRVWQVLEAELLQQIANQLAIAIQQANLFEQLQQELSQRQQAQQQLTERNQQLAISNNELVRATQLKDEFLANMSHELRTPLNAILGMTEGLQDEVFGKINTSQFKALQTIDRSGSHLLELINDILDVAKIESGQIELHRAPTAVASLCQSSLAFIKQQALKKHIQLEIKLPQMLPDLLVDERRIRQVLINLLNNAVKFTPEGGRVTLKVSCVRQQEPIAPPPIQGITRIRVYRTDLEQTLGLSPHVHPLSQDDELSAQYYLKIAVIDTGIGIAPEHLDKLFQPFIQIDSALNRQYEGTGLGLALVKRIVDLHEGHVELTSEVGVGSCFTILLPCTITCPLDFRPAVLNSHYDDLVQSEAVEPPLIVLAEDNEANIMTLSSYLQARGYRVLVAKTGMDAIALVQSVRPDLVLIAVHLPNLNELEVIQQIRQDLHQVNLPIIAIMTLATEPDRDRCLAAGATDCISKPIKFKQLTDMIQRYLEHLLV